MTENSTHEPFAGLFATVDDEPEFVSKIRAHDTAFADHVSALARTAGADGALSARTKTLITLALDAADGNKAGVRDLAAVARSQGVSEEELAETVKVVGNQGGLGTLAIAAEALADPER